VPGKTPLVSVVVPVFNRRDVITRAVESLVSQVFDQPFEIVVVDDGSTDDSADCARVNESVRVVRQHNQGSSAARLAGITNARGTFVAFLDSDDVACPRFLERLHEAFLRVPSAVLTFGRMGDLSVPRASTYELARQAAGTDG